MNHRWKLFDLLLYDYGTRFYYPALGRFHLQDRFAEKYTGLTPYHYCVGNPIRYIDVNGDSINVPPSWRELVARDGGQTGRLE